MKMLPWSVSIKIATNGQGFAQVGNWNSCLPEPSAECRIKKLIICSFAHSNRSARTADDSSTNAHVYSVCPTCAKPIVTCRLLSNSVVAIFTKLYVNAFAYIGHRNRYTIANFYAVFFN